MCGRYTLTLPDADLVEIFGVSAPLFVHQSRYNIAPTQLAPVIARDGRGTRMGNLSWGLIPAWSKDKSVASKLINARAETVRTKPSFRHAFHSRRCLVLADGFYEWAGDAGSKQPYWIHRPGRAPMTFAGLWESWHGSTETRHTFTIITVDASDDIRALHHRMPAILDEEERTTWLESSDPDESFDLLGPYRGALTYYGVSALVNSPRNDQPELLEPV